MATIIIKSKEYGIHSYDLDGIVMIWCGMNDGVKRV